MPGEISQETGRAYVFVFSGCLERAVAGFQQVFDVYTAPEKLSFRGASGTSYSFDLSGVLNKAEVFIESKGCKQGSGMLDSYKEFLAKAYFTSVHMKRHQKDYFWFVTNVPFGSSLGRQLWDPVFVAEALGDAKSPRAAAILGDSPVDCDHVRSLTQRLAVGIFTDSFVRVMGTLYKFRPGDTLWSVTKLLHGGRIPFARFEPIVARVQDMNDLHDPNFIRSGQRLHLPWFGIPVQGESV